MQAQGVTSEEKLNQLLESGKITDEDYQRLLKAVKKTQPVEIEMISEIATQPPADVKPDKLCKSWKNRQLGGVCGGLGIHLNIEPYIIRLIVFCLALVSWTFVLVVYLALYFYLPWDDPKAALEPRQKGHPWLFALGATFLLVFVPCAITEVYLEKFVSIYEDLGTALPPLTVLAYTIGRSFELNQHHVQIPWGLLLSFKVVILGTMGYLICHNPTVRIVYTIVFYLLSVMWSSMFLLVIYYTLFSLPNDL